jgi:hypothetical protein
MRSLKVKDLLAALSKADPEMDVCLFTEQGVLGVDYVEVWSGEYSRTNGLEGVLEKVDGEYVGIGQPGEYPATQQGCTSVVDLTDYRLLFIG